MVDIAIALGFLLGIACAILAVGHSLRARRVTLIDWSVLGIGGMYGVGWSLVLIATQAGENATWANWILPYSDMFWLHSCLVLVLLGGMWFGWSVAGTSRSGKRTRVTAASTQRMQRQAEEASWFLLIAGLAAQWLYSRAYGGFIGVLDHSGAIRSGIFPVNNPLSFLKPFGALVHFAAFGFTGVGITKRRRIGPGFGFALAIVASLYVLYLWRGRLGAMVFLATFPLGVLFLTERRPLKLMAKGGMLFLLVLMGTYGISIALNLKPADSWLAFFGRELSFPFASFFGQLDSGEHLFRAFKDIFMAPLYVLPSSLWSQWIDNVSQINTALIMGAPKGEDGVTGTIPVDLLTLGLMQASVFGVPIVGAIFGMMLRVAERMLERIAHAGVREVLRAYVTLKVAVVGVFYSYPAHLVASNVPLIVGVGVLAFFIWDRRGQMHRRPQRRSSRDPRWE